MPGMQRSGVLITRKAPGWYESSNGYTIEHRTLYGVGLWKVFVTPFAPDFFPNPDLKTFRTYAECRSFVCFEAPSLRDPKEV